MSKHALCIGINNYPGTENDLSGCVNDANDWAAALSERGFTVTKLIDAEATKASMQAGMKSLISTARGGDTVVITYSGHGTWVPDTSGDEPDGRDEGLCPHDIDRVGPLLDDDINKLFSQRAAGVHIILLSDSCHSGSVTRGEESDIDPGMPRARFMPLEAWMPKDKLPRATAPTPSVVSSGLSRAGGDLLLAGCTDKQFSFDTSFKGRPNGAFTFYALKVLKTLGPNATYNEWFKAIRQYLPSTRLPQNPQIFGTRSMRGGKVFG